MQLSRILIVLKKSTCSFHTKYLLIFRYWQFTNADHAFKWQNLLCASLVQNVWKILKHITKATLFIAIIMRWILILYLPFWIYCTKICYAFNIQWLSSNSSSCWAWIMKPIPHYKLLRPVKFCYLWNRKYILYLFIYLHDVHFA